MVAEDFSYDASIIPWGLEEYLYMDDIQELVEDSLVEQIEVFVPPLLKEMLSGLQLGFETDLEGLLDLSVQPSFDSVVHDEDGLRVDSSLSLQTDVASPRTGLGFLSGGIPSPALDPYAHLAAGKVIPKESTYF